MRLLSDYIKEPFRSAIRFCVIGTIGTFVQSGFFLLAMTCLGEPAKDTTLYYIAFGIGFVLEMIPNYFLMCFYTFRSKPNWENASGFLLARGVNLVLQFVCLPLALKYLPATWGNGVISFIVIFVAGIANFLIQRIFFLRKRQSKA